MNRLRYKNIVRPTYPHWHVAVMEPWTLIRFLANNQPELKADFMQILYWRSVFSPHFTVDLCYQQKEHFHMAKKAEWEFVEVKLQTTDKAKIDKFGDQFKNNSTSILEEVLSRGYKVSISWVDKQNSYVVSVSGTDRSKANNGTTMTSWSDDLDECICMMAYKVLELTHGGDWTEFATERSSWG